MASRSSQLGAVLLCLAFCLPALAQSESQVDEYRAHLSRGAKHYSNGDLPSARRELLAAYRIYSNPKILFNVAVTYDDDDGKSAEAREYFRKFVAACSKECEQKNGKELRKAKQRLAEMRRDKRAETEPDKQVRSEEPEGEAKASPLDNSDDDDVGSGSNKGRTLVYTGIGVGAAGLVSLGIGSFYGVRAYTYSRDINSAQSWSEELTQKRNDLPGVRTRFYVFTALGVAATATGVVLTLYGRKANREGSGELAVTPVVGEEVAGLSLSGSF